MNPATGWAHDDQGRDPYFHAEEVGPAKGPVVRASDPERRRRPFRLRTLMLVLALAAVWMGVLLDPNVAPLVLVVLGAFGIGLVVMAVAMGLGLLGFGLCTAGDRAVRWLRRTARWPEE